MATFHLEIITPKRIAYQEQVEMVVVPGSDGYMGILSHHVQLFAELKEGEVKIVKNGHQLYLAIGGGYVEVLGEKVTILVTKAVHEDELREEEILKAKMQAERILREKPAGEDIGAAMRLLRSTIVDLKLLQRRRHRTVQPVS